MRECASNVPGAPSRFFRYSISESPREYRMNNAHYHKEECYISGYLKFKTKVKIAFGLIQGIITNRVQFSRVRMDRFYRRQASLLDSNSFQLGNCTRNTTGGI
jgi:hypothetical protein